MKYAGIDRCRHRFSVELMCRLLTVSRSGYYASKTHPESTRSKHIRVLVREIKQVHADSKGVYGGARVTAELAEVGFFT